MFLKVYLLLIIKDKYFGYEYCLMTLLMHAKLIDL